MKTAGRITMTGAGFMVVLSVCLCALVAVLATAYRFAATGELNQAAVAWSTGLVGVASALLARTYQPAEPVDPGPVEVVNAPGDAITTSLAPSSYAVGDPTPPL